MSIHEALCGVCGSLLTDPLIICRECSTPHHADCWRYGGGCAVYACGGTIPAGNELVPAEFCELGAPAEEARPEIPLPKVLGAFYCFIGLLGAIHFSGQWILLLAAPVIPLVFGIRLPKRPVVPQIESTADDFLADHEALVLEKKALAALVGRGIGHELAQTYALFEQRRPREGLDPLKQKQMALEIEAAGYPALAAEAIEKAVLMLKSTGTEELDEVYRRIFAGDPAFHAEAVMGPAPARQDPARSRLPAGLKSEDLITGNPQYLLSLNVEGLPGAFQRPYRLPHELAEMNPQRTTRIAGPFDSSMLPEKLEKLRTHGQDGLPVDLDEIALPPQIHQVVGLRLASKSATLRTAEGEVSFPWEEVRTAIYVKLAKIEPRGVLESEVQIGGRGSQRTVYTTRVKEEVHHETILEIHAGGDLQRYRIHRPAPDLFAYLGRRKEPSHETNLALATKDLVRFGPHIRVSHGVHALLSERYGLGRRVESLRDLEEYVLWFVALGSERVRTWWARR